MTERIMNVTIALIFVGGLSLAVVGIGYRLSRPAVPPTEVHDTRVVYTVVGEIRYVFLRDASGRDTIGYSAADYQTIRVPLDSECWALVRLGERLPIACEEAARLGPGSEGAR